MVQIKNTKEYNSKGTNEIYRKRGTDHQKLKLKPKQKNNSSIDIQMNKEQKIKFI